jgi:hypothetical protein
MGLEVIIGDTVRVKNLADVGFVSASRSAHGDILSLEVGDGLDAAVLGGDDLDVLGIEPGDGGDVFDLPVLEELGPVVGVVGHVVLDDDEVHVPCGKKVDVFDGGSCGLGGNVDGTA